MSKHKVVPCDRCLLCFTFFSIESSSSKKNCGMKFTTDCKRNNYIESDANFGIRKVQVYIYIAIFNVLNRLRWRSRTEYAVEFDQLLLVDKLQTFSLMYLPFFWKPSFLFWRDLSVNTIKYIGHRQKYQRNMDLLPNPSLIWNSKSSPHAELMRNRCNAWNPPNLWVMWRPCLLRVWGVNWQC